MADTRINALATTAAASAADDFVAIDGTTNGTRKLSAYTPVFSTVTASGSMAVTGATGTVTLGAATETLEIAVTAAGAGTITPKSGQALSIVGTFAVSGASTLSELVSIARTSSADAGTSILGILTTTGAGATTSLGGDFRAYSGNSSGTTSNLVGLRGLARGANASTITNAIGLQGQVDNPSGATITNAIGLNIPAITVGTNNYAIYTAGGGLVLISDTTDSTTKDTGALIVEGGVGIEKALTVGTNIAAVGATSSVTLGAATETLAIAVTAAGAGSITPKSGQTLTIATGTAGITCTGTGSHIFGTTNTVTLAAGAITATSSITTGAPNTGTAAAWKFGVKVDATTTLDTAKYLQVDVAGTLYKVALVTS